MLVIVKIRNKQYNIKEGDIVKTEKLKYKKNQKIVFSNIILQKYENIIKERTIKCSNITAQIIFQSKETTLKKKRRKNYKKKMGNNQSVTFLKILQIKQHGDKKNRRKV